MEFLQPIVTLLLFLLAVFLIVLILIQRGKGGGLAGAFGGMGGQSAFGTKAGDLFTRITIGVAAVWILLCIVSVRLYGIGGSQLSIGGGAPATQQSAPANGTPSPDAAPAETPAPAEAPAPAEVPASPEAK